MTERVLVGSLMLFASCTADDLRPTHAGGAFDPTDPHALDVAESVSDRFVSNALARLQVEDVIVRHRALDAQGTAHFRVDQQLGGIPVFGAQAIVHVPSDGSAVWLTDGLLRDVQVDTRPLLTSHEAFQSLQPWFAGPFDRAEADLRVLRHGAADYLTWRLQLWNMDDEAPSMPVVFVDAHRGGIVWHYDNLQTAKDRDTYDVGNTTTLPGTLAREEGDAAIADDAVDDAHNYAGDTYDYFDTYQGRDSYDDAGATISSAAHYGTGYQNAFWNGVQVVYGDGGAQLDYMSKALDVVAHELTHAVTSETADLVYANESGGLNEATSDIMAAVVEGYADGWVVSADTWYVGEDVDKVNTAVRYMNDPPNDGVSIDNYDDYTTGMSVHYSSGVATHAFYEWVQDANVTLEEAGDIWYRGLLYYMTPDTTFAQARRATEQAATDLFGDGSSELLAVQAGWDHVNVPAGATYNEFDSIANGSGSAGSVTTHQFDPSSSAGAVRFTIEGDGNADLYVRFGSAPDLVNDVWDCASASPDSYELCEDDPASDGTYYVTIDGFDAYSNLTVRAWQDVDCVDSDGDGFTDCDGDCDDGNANVHPDATETCNGVDDDCNGTVDGADATDAVEYYADDDGDGYGDPDNPTSACSQPPGHVTDATDCDDTRADVNPAATERCNDIDDNCDGSTDGSDATDLRTFYADADADGYGDATTTTAACAAPIGYLADDTDCDDTRADVNPAATEQCNDIDDNCDGSTDGPDAADADTYYADADADGFGDPAVSQRACTQPAGTLLDDTDCDDTRADVNPAATERCNDIDDDCDGGIDGPASADIGTWYPDRDQDGFGEPSGAIQECSPPSGYVALGTDCDDTRDTVSPALEERCDDDDVDENCNGVAEEAGAIGSRLFMADPDGDGFGAFGDVVAACELGPGLTDQPGDCDATDPSVYPGAPESCADRRDTNCDGRSGNDDLDGDGHVACDDCDDGAPDRFPGAPEVCDGRDNDCNGAVDDDAVDATTYYVDADQDGYGDVPVEACTQPDGTAELPGDCDDSSDASHPAALELPDDGIDNNCDGVELDLVHEGSEAPSGCATSWPIAAPWWLLGVAWMRTRRRRPQAARAAESSPG